ncbi:MAG TPA: hypothetical protein VH325_16575 [Bryobacteraceae bacterium]|jgi:hypothetical protein|nr:hypothetical protein [Bryobacteraceae bacterium]
MLWLKAWYETRFRLLLVVVATLVISAVASDSGPASANILPKGLEATTLIGASVLAAIMLAGAGIKTQPAGFRPTKGLHGSMYYTLSLPVTRSRLFSVRVSLGLAETALVHVLACCAVWLVRPGIRLNAAPSDMFRHGVAAFFCVAAVYSLGVFFATFLDDLYQTWATMFTVMAAIVILNRVPLPPSLDAFLVLSRASPLITHTMPWFAIATLLGLSAMLLLISVRIIRSREY